MAKDKKEKDQTEQTPAEGERTAFDRVLLARHLDRPYTLDLIERLFEDFVELHGEYNLGGLILNKIILLRSLKLNEIIGAHYFNARYTGTTMGKSYYETSFGIEKFGLLRADFVLGFDDGSKVRTGVVFGLKLNIADGSIRLTD